MIHFYCSFRLRREPFPLVHGPFQPSRSFPVSLFYCFLRFLEREKKVAKRDLPLSPELRPRENEAHMAGKRKPFRGLPFALMRGLVDHLANGRVVMLVFS